MANKIYYMTVGLESNGKRWAVVMSFYSACNLAKMFDDPRIQFANIYPKNVAYEKALLYNEQYKLMGVYAE